ncbi:hypothetical protein PALS1_027 [Staphylococcus phage PALS_1]|nr:hypothetical protein PALS1_027 [Staphylococcus phage PALS_1]
MIIVSFFLSIPLFCFYYFILSGVTTSLGYAIYRKDKGNITLNIVYILSIYTLSVFSIWLILSEKIMITIILIIIIITAFIITIIPQNK